MQGETMMFKKGKALGSVLARVAEHGLLAMAWTISWAVRVGLVALLFAVPYAAGAFVEWQVAAVYWTAVTRLVVVIAWMAGAALLIYVLMDDSGKNVRKDPR